MHAARSAIVILGLTAACTIAGPAIGQDPNALTDAEEAAGFEVLFNGRDFEGWRQTGNWVIQDGAMLRAKQGGDVLPGQEDRR